MVDAVEKLQRDLAAALARAEKAEAEGAEIEAARAYVQNQYLATRDLYHQVQEQFLALRARSLALEKALRTLEQRSRNAYSIDIREPTRYECRYCMARETAAGAAITHKLNCPFAALAAAEPARAAASGR